MVSIGNLRFDDDFEVDRVVAVELKEGAKQSELLAALEPVVDRLQKRFKAAQVALKAARDRNDNKAAQEAQDEINSLILFKGDMGAYTRVYAFLSQIFDYGSSAVEKRAIFFKRLAPLLEFGREREGIDLTKLKLTHHTLKSQGKRALPVGDGDPVLLPPLAETGSGNVQEKEKLRLSEIIKKVNDLFEGDLTDDDQLIYVNNVLKGKLLESETLMEQAASNSKEQFAASPDLSKELMNAIMDALEAHNTMSNQALNSSACAMV